MEQQRHALFGELRRMIGHYFSDANLPDDHVTRAHLAAHGDSVPLLYLSTYKKCDRILNELEARSDPQRRLALLRAAVCTVSTLEIAANGTAVRRRSCPGVSAPPVVPAEAGAPATHSAIVVLRAAGGPPEQYRVAQRADYLHMLAELLGAAAVLPLTIDRKGYASGPRLYAGCAAPPPLRASNARVGKSLLGPGWAEPPPPPTPDHPQLAWSLLHDGDYARALAHGYLMADWEACPPRPGKLEAHPDPPPAAPNALATALCRCNVAGDAVVADVGERGGTIAYTDVTLRDVEALLASRSGAAGYMMAVLGAPMLGTWRVPASWPLSKTPRQVVHEYLAKAGVASAEFSADQLACGVGASQRFRGVVTVVASVFGGSRPANATTRGDTHFMFMSARRARSKAAAMDDVALALLEALVEVQPQPNPFDFERWVSPDEAGMAVHPDGTTLTVSYTLHLCADGGSAGGLGGAGQVLLEACDGLDVRLGELALIRPIEEMIAEIAEGQTREARLVARYRGAPATCHLSARVTHVTPPGPAYDSPDEAGDWAPSDGPSTSEQRRELLRGLVDTWTPSTIVDVGCGDGQLLRRLVSDGPSNRLIVGIDPIAKGLRRLSSALRKRPASGADGAGGPSVRLLHGSIDALPAAGVDGADLMILVEVVEHLDQPALDALGPILLGRCAPARLVVTTPNKEFNVNWLYPDHASTPPPPMSTWALRCSDHRFEWTRDEFREWATGLAAAHGYALSFRGVGCDFGAPFPGPITQVAIFERVAPASAATPQAIWDASGLAVASSTIDEIYASSSPPRSTPPDAQAT